MTPDQLEETRGCLNLIFAVLIQAKKDYFMSVNSKKYNSKKCEVTQWLWSDSEKPYSCKWCCVMVGIDVERFQNLLIDEAGFDL